MNTAELIARHFSRVEDESWITLTCLRCAGTLVFTHHAPRIYILEETIHHLQAVHQFPGASGGWQVYLESIPAADGWQGNIDAGNHPYAVSPRDPFGGDEQ